MDQSSSFQRVTRDILDLCELQYQLLSVDSQVARSKLIRAIIAAAIAVTLTVSSLTVLLVGTGFLLREYTSISTGGSMIIVSVVATCVVVALLAITLFAIKAAAAAMNETKSEFAENLRWLKATLLSPDASHCSSFVPNEPGHCSSFVSNEPGRWRQTSRR